MFRQCLLFGSSLALAVALVQQASAQQSCESLTSLKLQNATVSSATVVAEGPFQGPRPGGPPATPLIVPEHCEVKGVATPTSDSEIKFEVWLPTKNWNGNFEQVGNGGWAGAIPRPSLADSVRRGYAGAGTDDGHTGGGNAEWAIGHPEKLIDFGYRAVHETSIQAKTIIRAFYGKENSRAYFVGCSDGGREALMEAQRYPNDFNGIVAGAPANYWTHLLANAVWNAQALTEAPASYIPSSKLAAIQKAVLAQCDTLDGVKDGLIEDPRRCKFDPELLRCKDADSSECLTEPQIVALKKIYEGPKNPRTGEQLFPGFSPGAEAAPGGWALWITGASPAHSFQFMFGNTYFADAVFGDVKWDYRTLNFDSDVQRSDSKNASILDSNNPDLTAFKARGGKLIQYHGWGDAAIPPLSSIFYYERVRSFMEGPKASKAGSASVESFYRLFMVPGMGHCGGGLGANNFGNSGVLAQDPEHDIVAALDLWVEKGIAPEKIIATGYLGGSPTRGVALTRPLCPYP
ncbi:MAG TPA: tannase/feruloyl esterase family alpha/beta hydrolase, partial [Blastocatellia bacterium]|nr:tannase/feruloyl esterase family alpha/beta hydrolase [Blastocatellia bacterium]